MDPRSCGLLLAGVLACHPSSTEPPGDSSTAPTSDPTAGPPGTASGTEPTEAEPSPTESAASAADVERAWAALAKLPGRWVAKQGEAVIVADYRATAGGSVLLETWMPGTPAETLTTYHRDGDRLMLTHYCGQGNQPRLHLTGVADGGLSFSRFDVTNHQPEQGVLTELTLTYQDDRLVRTELYTRGEEREQTTLEFERLPLSEAQPATGSSRVPGQ